MEAIRTRVLARVLETKGEHGLGEHLTRQKTTLWTADTLADEVQRYEALGNPLTPGEQHAVANVYRVLDAQSLFTLSSDKHETLAAAKTMRVKGGRQKARRRPGAPPFSSKSAPRVIDGKTPSGHDAAWSFIPTQAGNGQPVPTPDGTRVFALSNQGTLSCLDATTGTELWSANTGTQYSYTTPAVSPDGKTVVVGSGYAQSRLHAYDVETGRFKWSSEQTNGGSYQQSSPTFSEDGQTVFLACADDRVRAYDAESGAERWARPGPKYASGLSSAPVLSPDGKSLLVVGTRDLQLYDAATGDSHWTVGRKGESYAVPAFSPDGETFYLTGGGTIMALDSGNGQERWSTPTADLTSKNVNPLVTPDGALVVLPLPQGSLQVFDAEGGRVRATLSHPSGRELVAAPALVEGTQTLYAVDNTGTLLAVDVSDPDPAQWTTRTIDSKLGDSVYGGAYGTVYGGFALSTDGKWAFMSNYSSPQVCLTKLSD